MDWRTARRKQRLEKKSSNKLRRVTWNVTNRRSATKRWDKDKHWTLDNEKKVKVQPQRERADPQLTRTRGLTKRTDQEAACEIKNLSTAEEPQRVGSQTVDAHEVAGLPTSWAATTNVAGTQLEPDWAQLDVKDGRISKGSSSVSLPRFLRIQKTAVIPQLQYTEEKFYVTDEQDRARWSRRQRSPTMLVDVIAIMQTSCDSPKAQVQQRTVEMMQIHVQFHRQRCDRLCGMDDTSSSSVDLRARSAGAMCGHGHCCAFFWRGHSTMR